MGKREGSNWEAAKRNLVHEADQAMYAAQQPLVNMLVKDLPPDMSPEEARERAVEMSVDIMRAVEVGNVPEHYRNYVATPEFGAFWQAYRAHKAAKGV